MAATVTKNDASRVTAGKPKVGGSVFRAPAGTALPTDASSELSEVFECLGYISEDGLNYATERETEEIKAWGGDTVLRPQTGFSDSVTMTFIEALNINVQKTVRGDANVSGTLEQGMTVKVNGEPDTPHVYVIEQVLNGNVAFRTVIPNGTVTEIGEVTYADGDAVGYETTIGCTVDANGQTRYEYYKKAEGASAA